jgi:hypothetical protein
MNRPPSIVFPAKGVRLSQVKILQNGHDGGFLYIKGRGDVPGQGEQDIYAYFDSRQEQLDFERQFSGQSVIIDGDSLEFTPSHATAIRSIISWRFE